MQLHICEGGGVQNISQYTIAIVFCTGMWLLLFYFNDFYQRKTHTCFFNSAPIVTNIVYVIHFYGQVQIRYITSFNLNPKPQRTAFEANINS